MYARHKTSAAEAATGVQRETVIFNPVLPRRVCSMVFLVRYRRLIATAQMIKSGRATLNEVAWSAISGRTAQ